MNLYCTLDDARSELKARDTREDDLLLRYIEQVSRRIDLELKRNLLFVPVRAARTMLVTPERVNSMLGTLALDTPLLALEGVSLNGSTLTVGTEIAAYPPGASSVTQLRLVPQMGGCRTWYSGVGYGDLPTAVIDGVWGYSAEATPWLPVGALGAAIDASQTLIDVGDASAYSVGMLLRVGDEYLEVTHIPEGLTMALGLITVRRGVNGTSADAHSLGATVAVWQVETNIRRVTARQSGLLYTRRGAFEQRVISDVGITSYPPDLLAEMRGVLNGFAYL